MKTQKIKVSFRHVKDNGVDVDFVYIIFDVSAENEGYTNEQWQDRAVTAYVKHNGLSQIHVQNVLVEKFEESP